MQISLGIYSLHFLRLWLGIPILEARCPYGNVLYFQDSLAFCRLGSRESLKTCYTGVLPFSTSCEGGLLPRLLSMTGPQSFHLSAPEEEGTEAIMELVERRGWSWNSAGGLVFVSNTLGAAYGIPPNPTVIGAPSFLSFIGCTPSRPSTARPSNSKRYGLLLQFCMGYSRTSEKTVLSSSTLYPECFHPTGDFKPDCFCDYVADHPSLVSHSHRENRLWWIKHSGVCTCAAEKGT